MSKNVDAHRRVTETTFQLIERLHHQVHVLLGSVALHHSFVDRRHNDTVFDVKGGEGRLEDEFYDKGVNGRCDDELMTSVMTRKLNYLRNVMESFKSKESLIASFDCCQLKPRK